VRRALVLRTASNYAHAPPSAASPVYSGLGGGLGAGVEAAWRVGSPVVRALVAGWDRYAEALPGTRP
jgi:purine nucleoside permease